MKTNDVVRYRVYEVRVRAHFLILQAVACIYRGSQGGSHMHIQWVFWVLYATTWCLQYRVCSWPHVRRSQRYFQCGVCITPDQTPFVLHLTRHLWLKTEKNVSILSGKVVPPSSSFLLNTSKSLTHAVISSCVYTWCVDMCMSNPDVSLIPQVCLVL